MNFWIKATKDRRQDLAGKQDIKVRDLNRNQISDKARGMKSIILQIMLRAKGQ